VKGGGTYCLPTVYACSCGGVLSIWYGRLRWLHHTTRGQWMMYWKPGVLAPYNEAHCQISSYRGLPPLLSGKMSHEVSYQVSACISYQVSACISYQVSACISYQVSASITYQVSASITYQVSASITYQVSACITFGVLQRAQASSWKALHVCCSLLKGSGKRRQL